MPVVARCFRITGKVQGVYFRASTRQQAASLGLSGYAKNLDDGSVEVLAIGQPEAVAKLQTWLSHGPPTARVAKVESNDADVTQVGHDRGFATL